MTISKIYQWERFWCPASGSYRLDDSGFLVDPKSQWGRYYQDSTVLTFDEIPATSCLVLLGEPGIGKTKALHDAFISYSSSVQSTVNQSKPAWIDLRSYSSDIGLISGVKTNLAIQDWLNGDYKLALFLDSLDEGLLNVKTIAGLLIDLLRDWPREKLEIKFACRTSDWPNLLDNELRFLFTLNEIPKYELLPLRKVDVETAATTVGVDANLFIEAVQDAEAVAFANRPVTLNFLLNSYKADGRLSKSKSKIYWQGCLHLSEERNESRLASKQTGKLSAAQRLFVAGRISTVMMFSQKYSIWIGTEGDNVSEDLSIRSLSGYSERVDGIDFSVDEEAIKDTLGTGLFNSRGESRIGFSHQTYPEYLAAYYLIQKQVPFEKILSLITSSDGKIIPQLQEVTIWLATFSDDVFTALLEVQPDIVLRIPKDVLTNARKKKVLAKLLSYFQVGKLIDHYDLRRYFSRLEYDGMADQLGPYLSNSKKTFQARRAAILIARECKLVELENTLVSVSLNQKENHVIRKDAGHTVNAIGSDNAQLALMPLALSKTIEDPDDELKAIGFRAIWGKSERIGDLLESITPVKDENLIGSYHNFLSYEFAELVRAEHLYQVLQWLLERKTNVGSQILEDAMVRSVMYRAWKYFDDPQIAEVFAKLAYKRLLGFQESRATSYDKSYTKDLAINPIKRRSLVSRIVDLMNSSNEAFYLFYNPSFLFHDDIDWVIENIGLADKSVKREIWAELLSNLADFHNQDDLAKVYSAYERFSEIKAIFLNIFGPIDPNSDIAKQWKSYEKHRRTTEQTQVKEADVSLVDYYSKLNLYIDQFNDGDLDAWWRLNLLFLGSNPDKDRHDFEIDLTSFTLWENIDVHVRENLVSVAQIYLSEHSGAEIWLDEKTIYRPAISAFRALYLIAIKKPELLDNLAADVWGKWASVVLSYPVFDSSKTLAIHQLLTSKLHVLSENSFYDSLRKQLDKEEKTSQYLAVLQLIEHLEAARLEEVLVEFLESENLSSNSFGQILQFLLQRNSVRAKQIALEFVHLEVSTDDNVSRKTFHAARSLLLYSDDAGWPTLSKRIKNDEKFGAKLFQDLAHNGDNLAGTLAGKITESNVAELYNWLEKGFPEVDDPKVGGVHTVSERESVGQFRNWLIVALARKGNEQACLSLSQLIIKYPEKSNLPYYLKICEENMRRNDWLPYEPHYILTTTRNAYKEYVQGRRNVENFVIGVAGGIAALLVEILLNTLNYEKLNAFKSNQLATVGIIVLLTIILIVVNSRRSIPD